MPNPAERLAVLRHGVNITDWFRFPVNQDPRAMRAYLGDPALQDLRRAGFSFVRLPVQPEVLARPGMLAVLTDAIGRSARHGLGVVLSLHPVDWHLETAWGSREVARHVALARSGVAPIRPTPDLRGGGERTGVPGRSSGMGATAAHGAGGDSRQPPGEYDLY